MKPSNDCSCTACLSACLRKPGWFKPGEVETAASLVGMPIKDFFNKYIMVDYWVGDAEEGDYIYNLSPAIPGYAGRVAPFLSPTGRCAFLEDNKCSIHEAKPAECANYYHTFDYSAVKSNHKEAGLAWKDHQAQIIELLGHDPRNDI